MHEGLCGWEGKLEFFERAKACYLAFFDMDGSGSINHVGILTRDVFMEYVGMFSHSSKKHGFIQLIIEKDKKDYYYIRSIGFKNIK